MTTGFFDQLEARVAATGSLLCVGLDPRTTSPRRARDHCLGLIEATADLVAAFKPNSAFFEELGPAGMKVLAEVIAAVPEGIPVLLDAKRGDIASTAEAYAAAVFGRLGAGAVTVSPYLGRDSIEPFLEHEGRGVFVLCRTSNRGGRDFQDVVLASGEPLYRRVARSAAGWAGPDQLGLVVGATEPGAVAQVRAEAPQHWILAPGIGAQGGSLEAVVAAGVRSDGLGLLLPVSRAIAEASDPASSAAELNEAVGRARSSNRPVDRPAQSNLAVELFDAGCVRLGDFELKSGKHSPIYLDLRTLTGHPPLMQRVARRYVPLLGTPDRLAGVPLAGLPIATAVSLESGLPMVYPRPATKDHGTRSAVEGPFEPGDRVVAVDDVATSGTSVLEAVARLRRAGLLVGVAVVLIDRGAGASGALAADGIELRSVMHLADVVGSLAAAGRIDDSEAARVYEFLEA